jgi:hypothetical protein
MPIFVQFYIAMKNTDYVAVRIDRLPRGFVFTYDDFVTEVNAKESIIKTLNRMVASGKIAKIAKGKFYKPETTVFGNLEPNQYQVVKDLLEQDGKTIGYLTGYSIYNSLGLTTQVSNTIQVGKNDIRPAFKRDRYTISFIKQKNTITKENIPLLQILDAIRYIKNIPDADLLTSCNRFLAILKELPKNDKPTLLKLSMKYPPVTRALLGALLEEIGDNQLTTSLQKSLNPITVYKLQGANKILSKAEKWNIK